MNLRYDKELSLKLIIQRLSNLVTYLLEIIKQKDEQLQAKYRLIDWVEKKGVGFCRIQLVGTSTVNDYKPNEIVADDNFISGFSQLDIRTITNLANHEKNKPKSSICSVDYENNLIEVSYAGKQKSKIFIDGKIHEQIENFSKKDVFNLGRIVGENDVKI